MLAFALQAVTAFNLVCTGTFTMGPLVGRPEQTSQVNIVLRVDLARGRWCEGACTETKPLSSVTGTLITFEADGDVMGSRNRTPTDHWRYANRENGNYLDRTRIWNGTNYYVMMTRGTCERAPFTGFPQRRF